MPADPNWPPGGAARQTEGIDCHACAPCTIRVEVCTGAHHSARQFEALGHAVRLAAPKSGAPHGIRGKRGVKDMIGEWAPS
jgi:hypothetical protein